MFRLHELLAATLSGSLASAALATDFAGTWTGTVTAPNARAALGFEFVKAGDGLRARMFMPDMFVYGVDIGPATIVGDTFTFEPLDIRLTLAGETLAGTFAPARLPVKLARGGTFTKEPPSPVVTEGPSPVWTRALGAQVWASPAVRDGCVYVGAVDGRFHAVRARDGAELWTWSGPHALYGEACVDADALYFVDDAGELASVKSADGSLRWRFELHDATLALGARPANETFNRRTPLPVIDDGVLYVGSTDGGLYAIDARTGKKLWRHDARARIYAGIALRGDELVAACYDGTILRLDRRTLRESARRKLPGACVSTPVLAGDAVVVGCRDYMLYGLDAASSAIAWRDSYWFSWVESVPRFVDGTLYIGGSDFRRVSAVVPADGRMLWSTDVRGLTWGTPAVTATTVFAGTSAQRGALIEHEGGLVALDRKSGAVKWRRVDPLLDGAERAGYIGSLVLADEHVIGVTFDGVMSAFPVR
ncbi:MAG: PQQ-binding-like beta-propeller repeat protein [Planctomycetota bacterium]